MHLKVNDKLTKAIIVLIVIILVYLAVKYALDAILPFVFGFTVSILIRKAVRFIQKATGLNSKIAGGACLALCYALIFTALFFGIRLIMAELIDLIEHFPEFYNNTVAPIISDFLKENSVFNTTILSFFNRMEQTIIDLATTISAKAASAAAKIALNIPEIFITVTVTIVASFFICIDYDKIIGFLLAHLPKAIAQKIIKLKNTLFNSLWKLCGCYLIILLITFGELFVGLSLLGIRYSAAAALIISIADILPLIGTGTILIPWSLISLIRGNAPLAVGLFALYLIITVVRNVIEPKLIGKNIGLHPLLTLAAMYIGLKLGGIFLAMLLPLVLMNVKLLNDNGVFRIYRKT